MISITFLIMSIETHAKTDDLDFIRKYNKQETVCRMIGFKDKGIIAFHARTSILLQNVAKHDVVVFGTATLNKGGAYDSSTGKFTAPEGGIYSFTWTISTHAGSFFTTEIVINDRIIGYNHVNGGSYKNHETASATAIINMEKNDKVWIRVHNYDKSYYAFKDFCSFSGFRL